MRRRLSAFALLALIGLCVWRVEPPHSISELVFAQLRLPVHSAAPAKRDGAVLLVRRVDRVPPPIQRRGTAALFAGQRHIARQGTPGKVAIEHPVKVPADGLARALTARRVPITPPKPTQMLVGTSPVHYLMRGGVVYRYSRRMTLVATAYNASYAQNGPWGAVARLGGVHLTQGMVAVDPSVIPLGTRLYVEGYGPALAADTGSAIKGDRIDLFYDLDAQQTAAFGIKRLNVYILGPQGA